jgi:hypothetical protein
MGVAMIRHLNDLTPLTLGALLVVLFVVGYLANLFSLSTLAFLFACTVALSIIVFVFRRRSQAFETIGQLLYRTEHPSRS